MQEFFNIIQIFVILLFPWFAAYLAKEYKIFNVLGAVILCYVGGILMGLLPETLNNEEISQNFTKISIIVAIPLILLSNNPKEWIRSAKTTLLAFFLATLSVIIVSVLMAFFYHDKLDSIGTLAGMMVGVYTGGTPNLTSIGKALGVDDHIFLLVNGADIFLGGIYLFLLLSVMRKVLLLFLPKFSIPKLAGSNVSNSGDTQQEGAFWKNVRKLPLLMAFLLVAALIGASIGLSLLVLGTESAPLILLSITTMAILFSFIPKVRNIKGTFDSGNYLVMLFCVALGAQINLDKFVQAGSDVFIYVALVMFFSIIVHYLFCYFFKIDADTTIITSTAAIFGTPMIIPVARALGNNHLIMPGISASLAGYTIANYAGLLVALIINYLF